MSNTARYIDLAKIRKSMGPKAIITTHQPRRIVK